MLSKVYAAALRGVEAVPVEVKGQETVKRALEIAAAGGHNLILIGPPGTGKSKIVKRLGTILPPLTLDEALETTRLRPHTQGRPHHGRSGRRRPDPLAAPGRDDTVPLAGSTTLELESGVISPQRLL